MRRAFGLTCLAAASTLSMLAHAQDAATPAGIEPPRIAPPPPLPPPLVAPSPPPGSSAPESVPPIAAAPPAGARVYGPADPNALVAAPAPPAIPPLLAAAATKATTDYPSIRFAEGQIRAAGRDVSAAKWQRFPSASLQGTGFQGGNVNAARSNLGVDFTVDQPIWTFGRIEQTIRAAEAREDVGKGQLAENKQAVALGVVQAYYQMLSAARSHDIMTAGREQLTKLTESIGRRVEQGVSPAADRIQAYARLQQLETDIATNQGKFLSAQQRYRNLTGDPAATLMESPAYDAATAHPSDVGAAEELKACDPKRQRLEAETQVAIHTAKEARARLLPSLSLQFQQSEILGTRAGLVVRAQTSGGLSGVAAAQGAQIRADSSRVQIEQNDREALDALMQDFIENVAAGRRLESSTAAAISARDTVDSYYSQFIIGRRQWLEVINAEREATMAALTQSDTEVTAMNTAARILLRTCRWQP